MRQAAIIFMGSEKDKGQAEKIISFWEKGGMEIEHEARALSAHKFAGKVTEALAEYEKKYDSVVFIAIAGRSNALGPLIAGHSRFPVINCPVLSEKFGFTDLLSSVRMPSNVACSTILEPENAALHAAKILSLNDTALAEKISAYMESARGKIAEADAAIKREFGKK